MKASELKNCDLIKERQMFACLIAFHIGALSEGWLDGLDIIDECISIAYSYDFEMECEDDGEYLIVTEIAREAAEKMAAEIVERENYHEGHR